MHKVQDKLIKLSGTRNLYSMSLREIGKAIGVDHPQTVKYHLGQVERKGLLLTRVKSNSLMKPTLTSPFFSIPILGEANCGRASIFTADQIKGFLTVSTNMVKRKNGLFALKASGDSMNQANVDGHSIEDGDYVIVDRDRVTPKSGDYVVSVIDECANIKRFVKDTPNKQIVLISESSHDYPPIYIHEKDFASYLVNGTVTQVIKQPKIGS